MPSGEEHLSQHEGRLTAADRDRPGCGTGLPTPRPGRSTCSRPSSSATSPSESGWRPARLKFGVAIGGHDKIFTDMIENQPDAMKEVMRDQPIGHPGRPEEVAAAVMWLGEGGRASFSGWRLRSTRAQWPTEDSANDP